MKVVTPLLNTRHLIGRGGDPVSDTKIQRRVGETEVGGWGRVWRGLLVNPHCHFSCEARDGVYEKSKQKQAAT
jgi:hypothetical protein